MAQMKLDVGQRVAYMVTTKRNFSDSVADNQLNQNFNPTDPNQVWAGATRCEPVWETSVPVEIMKMN